MAGSGVEWKAKWIWDAFNRHTANIYLGFVKGHAILNVNESRSIRIYCTCSSEYKLFINGNYIGRGTIPSQVEFQYFDEYCFTGGDLKKIFKAENNISIIGYNYGVGLHYRPVAPAGLLFQMEIEYMDGTREFVVSDSSWKTAVLPWWKQNASQMYWTVGFQEIVDLKGYDPSFFGVYPDGNVSQGNAPSATGAIWNYAVEIGAPPVKPWINLIPRDIPYLLEMERKPLKVLSCGECSMENNYSGYIDIADIIYNESHFPLQECRVEFEKDRNRDALSPENILVLNKKVGNAVFVAFDFGQEVVGYPVLEFACEGGGILDIGYSEGLDDRGRVDPARQGIKQADRIIFRKGNFTWEIFGRRAFRYLQLTIRNTDKPVKLKKVYIKNLNYPFENQGSFKCSSELLNDIYETSKYTLDVCMKEHYEDCPLRERAQYIGDMRVEAVMNYYAFGDTKLIAKGLRQFARDQREDGWFKTLCPGSTNHNIVDYLPVWVMALWDYYFYTGDVSLLEELYENLVLLMDWLKSQTNEYGLLEKKADWWVFIDWADIRREGSVTALQCFYYKSLMDAARISGVLGDKKRKMQYLLEAVTVKASINRLLWDEIEEAYVDCMGERKDPAPKYSVQTNYTALLFKVADEKRKESIRKYLKRKNYEGVKTGYFKFYEMDALFAIGELDRFRYEFGYWAEMLRRGATTFWEIFDAEKGVMPGDSLCHAWSSAPLYHIPAKILGIRPVKPGFEEFVLQPSLFDLDWAEGTVPTPRGEITVKIQQRADSIQMLCSIPDRTVAHILIPAGAGKEQPVCVLNGSAVKGRAAGGKYFYKILDKKGEHEILVNLPQKALAIG